MCVRRIGWTFTKDGLNTSYLLLITFLTNVIQTSTKLFAFIQVTVKTSVVQRDLFKNYYYLIGILETISLCKL